jgi:hypothetical protein
MVVLTVPYALQAFINHNNTAAYEDLKNIQEYVQP